MTFYRSLIGAFLVSVAASATYAKPPKLSTTMDGYKACFIEASKNHEISKDGDIIQFKCGGDVAESFYEMLGRQGANTQSQTLDNGTYMVRLTNIKIGNGQDFCGQHTAEADLSPATGYTCVLHSKAGTFH
jgi:hypothetical protein